MSNFNFWNFWRARAKNWSIWIFEKSHFFLGGQVEGPKIDLKRARVRARQNFSGMEKNIVGART